MALSNKEMIVAFRIVLTLKTKLPCISLLVREET